MKHYYFLLALFFGAVAVIHAFPPALSFSPYKFPTPIEQHHAICKYCICDQHQKSVICAGSHILINTVHLPPWTSMFHVHNVTLPQMPHFGYSPNLKVLRINFCGLSQIHPLSFVPLPNLETIHLADNDLTEFPETLMSKMDKLRILNLARNKITNLSNIEFAIPDGLVLEQLVLDGNPIRFGFKEGTYKWPMTRQVHMANTRMVKLNGTFAVFEASPMCEDESCRSLRIPTSFWSHLITADFGANPELKIHPQAMPLLANLTALNLAETHLADSALTLFHPEANLRHLDLSKAKLDQQILQDWHYCTGRLEWLDISHIGLEDMNLGQSCSSLQWLFVSGNKLKKANIDARGLRVLHLDNNEIIEWPFPTGPGMTGKLRQLETLNLGLNKLSRLPSNALKGFITLSTLDLSHNKLMELNRESFPVIELELRFLNLTMPLLANLTALNLAETHLADSALTLFHPEANLRHLDLSKAKLDQQILQDWHYCTGRLEWLDISHIGLEDMNLGQSCSSLQWLFVSGNKLKKANIDARGLRVLHLDNNEIIEWPFPTGPGMTGKLRQLETLNLGFNKLSRLPSNALKGFITLSTLDLSHNKLMELNRESFPVIELELRFLNLSFNILTKFPEIILPNLQVLDLSANDLNSDGLNLQIFEGLPTLQHLFLSKNPYILDDCNRIYNDRGEKAECWLNSAKQLEKLSELDLSECDIKKLPNDCNRIYNDRGEKAECWLNSAKQLEKLSELDLSECDIKKLPSLKGFIKLQSLNLAENEIDSFDSFELPENLRKLNLQNNRIHSIGNLSTSPVATHLQDLELGNNPLHCECSLFSVAKLLKIQPDYADRSIYYCFADNWQHPLKSYFEVNERFCDNENLYGPSLLAMFFNIIGMLILCSAVAVLFGFIMLRAYRTVGCKIASYAPVPSEPPVEV
uniref:Uncharacterized protein n=1 Tax=Panagrolaimus sp. JU765 TaxID=591449 RepID=A0AC34PZV5_9BILA